MPQKPEILDTRIIAQSRFFRIQEVELKFSNGSHRIFERIRGTRGAAVMIIPMLDNDQILLVREYGCGIDDYYLSFPKGIVEAGEDLLSAANRELQEEIGYAAKDLSQLKTLSTSPGYMGRGMQMVLARELYPASLPGDEPEPIEVVAWHLSDIKALLARDDFHDARSVAAVYMLKEMFSQ